MNLFSGLLYAVPTAGRSRARQSPALLRLLLAVSLGVLTESSLEARCGVQRWDVKTGKDAQAASINLSSPTPTTIAFLTDLTRFPPPHPWPPPNRIAPEETTFWTLDATLDMYKFENDPQSGDSDYHLVIKDDAGNTMVAEIPFPGCVQGSAWVTQITQARATFDAKFTATSTPKSGQNTPVRITGIAMFDKTAHGSGHSPNGMEIHPVLSIVFNPAAGPSPTPTALGTTPTTLGPTATPTPAPGPTTTPGPSGANLIQNGDFENGDLGWDTSSGVISREAQAHGGFWCAWLGGYGKKHTDTLSQTVDLPAGGSSATLSFWLHIETEEVQDTAFDTLKAQIADEAGTVLQTLHTFSNRDASPHYERVHFNVTPFLGRRVRVRFVASEDSGKATSFYLDTVRLATN
jgi:hypothetical protein